MAAIGVVTLDIKLDNSHSLKDKRHIIRSLKDRLAHRHNVAVAEISYHDLWQRAVVAAVTVANDRKRAEQTLQSVEKEASSILGPFLIHTNVEWLG